MTYLKHFWNFIIFILRDFWVDDCLYRAAALTFTSLLAIVPLMSVSFTIISAFPVFRDFGAQIQNFIFAHFVPTSGKVVQTYLQSFTAQASQLSVWGIAFLVGTAVLMLFTIESALNTIWQVKEQRKGLSAFLLYWAVLSLAPLFIVLSIVVSSYFVSLPFLSGTLAHLGALKAWLLAWLPFLLATITLTLLYVAVPNTKVKIWHGLMGAIVAAISFELAKTGFTFYLQQYRAYQLLYGAFATVPIFFLWIYWVWVIILLGAEVAHACGAFYQPEKGESLDPFTLTLFWLSGLFAAQQKGEGLSLSQLMQLTPHRYAHSPEIILAHLLEAQIVKSVGDGSFLLSRDLSHFTLADLYEALPWRFPSAKQLTGFTKDLVGIKWREAVVALEATSKVWMHKPLVAFMKEKETASQDSQNR